jgi:hypothetical protein
MMPSTTLYIGQLLKILRCYDSLENLECRCVQNIGSAKKLFGIELALFRICEVHVEHEGHAICQHCVRLHTNANLGINDAIIESQEVNATLKIFQQLFVRSWPQKWIPNFPPPISCTFGALIGERVNISQRCVGYNSNFALLRSGLNKPGKNASILRPAVILTSLEHEAIFIQCRAQNILL